MTEIPRSQLPIPDPPRPEGLPLDAKDPEAVFPPIEPLRPPAGAPNVLIVLLDDVGFAASSAFGGPCMTPTAERLAARGLKYNRFHTTALCSPTRQALLTGRNHHSVGMGGITEIATSAPGYNSIRPKTAAPLAEIRATLAEQKVPDAETASTEATWSELDVDSLDLVELAQIVEDEFGVELGADDVKDLKTVGDAVDLIVAKGAS